MMLNNVSSSPESLSLPEIMAFVNAGEAADNSLENGVSIAFLRNFTVEGIEPYLKYHCLQAGVKPKISFGGYDTFHQEILDPDSHLYSSPSEIIVLSLVLDQFVPDYCLPNWNGNVAIKEIESLFSLLMEKTSAIIAVNSFMPPLYADYGITNVADAEGRFFEVARLNQTIRAYVKAQLSRFILIDWERLICRLGEDESLDYRFWYMSKAPFKRAFLESYALELVKVIRALKGKAKKCLVLDCDNTLWGGIIGEDGLDGIKLDPHTYPGNLFYGFQRSVLTLFSRGVLIALCSKNNADDVWDVLDNHPHSLIKRHHLVASRVNWEDKASNIVSLAEELNLGLDSFVFVDDNPAECELIRQLVSEVTIMTVPTKLYTYPLSLMRDGLFDTLTLSQEDRVRSQMYQAESLRKNEACTAQSLEHYLASLELKAYIHEANNHEVGRIAQLTQKTNQFNLTTRRYSEIQIASFVNSPEHKVFSLTVSDKFGDSGLTGVLIVRHEDGIAMIDSFLLSCRILGKELETAFFRYSLKKISEEWGITSCLAEYVPSKKNSQVSDFWTKMGFKELSDNDGAVRFSLLLDASVYERTPFIMIVE